MKGITDEELILQILSQEADDEEYERFQELLAEDELLKKEYEQIGRAWYCGKYAGKWGRIEENKGWQRIENYRMRYKRRIYFRYVAAMLILALGTGMFFMFREGRQVVGDEPFGNTGIGQVVLKLASGEKVELNSCGRQVFSEGGVSVQADSAMLVYHPQTISAEPLYNELFVPIGGEYQLTLSDGTVVHMNSDSRLKYPVIFGPEDRTVELTGEAYFEVTTDSTRPFRVLTPELGVQVLGTSFNVTSYVDEGTSMVTLLCGRVSVNQNGQVVCLTPNEQLRLDKETGETIVQVVDANKICAWTKGILYFDGMTLGDLGEKLRRWFGVEFFFTSEKLKHLKFSGALSRYASITYNLELIEATTDIQFLLKDKTVEIRQH